MGDASELLKQADGVLMGSPVYFGTVSSQLKAFGIKHVSPGEKARSMLSVEGLQSPVPALGAGNHPQGAPRYDAGTGHDDCRGWLCGL